MISKLSKWEFWGAVVIITLGSLSHFAFEWFGQWKPTALFLAVNESVWEHCKIAFWPALLFSVLEYFFINNKCNNFIVAKAVQLLIIPASIITMFYTYSGILGFNLLPIDIGIFILSIILGQYISYKILVLKELPKWYTYVSYVVILILIIAFSTLTFYPGSIALFKDSEKGIIGIQ